MFQTTIARESSAEGVGLHTGVHGSLRLVPAPAETGIVFRRVDLDNSQTFGGFHWNNPRELFVELRYRFHY